MFTVMNPSKMEVKSQRLFEGTSLHRENEQGCNINFIINEIRKHLGQRIIKPCNPITPDIIKHVLTDSILDLNLCNLSNKQIC